MLAATTLLMASAYFVAALFGLAMLADAGGVAVFWPASGVAVGALLVLGRTSFIPVALGVAMATIAANLVAGRPLAAAPLFALANVVECLTIGWLADRLLGSGIRFDSLRRVLGVFLAAVVGTLAGGAIGAGAMALLGIADPFLTNWHLWFRSDLIGVVTMTPLILGARALGKPCLTTRDHVEGLILVGLLSLTALVVYPDAVARMESALHAPLALIFPALLLLAIRLPLTYSPLGASAVALIMVASTIADQPIAVGTIVRAQITILATVACSLSLSALIAERRSSEIRQRLLMRELDHRVKNALTLVMTLVERSRQASVSADDFYTGLQGRIGSMARTHSMLSREQWQSLELRTLVASELAPYQDRRSSILPAPYISLGPSLAQSLSLVLHELTANAVKYGALSDPSGRVTVGWRIETGDHNEKVLVIEWHENAALPIKSIGPEGYGISIIRDLLKYEAGGAVTLSFPPEGARCSIRLPVSSEITAG